MLTPGNIQFVCVAVYVTLLSSTLPPCPKGASWSLHNSCSTVYCAAVRGDKVNEKVTHASAMGI